MQSIKDSDYGMDDVMEMEEVSCCTSGFWADLPGVVACKVVNSLDARATAKARLVCSSWASTILEHRHHIDLNLPVQHLSTGALKCLPALNSLRLRCKAHAESHDSYAKDIAAFLSQRHHTPLEVDLDLSYVAERIGAQDVSCLSSCLGVSITRLSLRGIHVGPEAARSLGQLTSLTDLDMGWCNAGPLSLSALSCGLTSLRCLDWSGNTWFPHGDPDVLDILRPLGTSLTKLSLANCTFVERGLASLVALPRLRLLDLSIHPTAKLRTPSEDNNMWLSNAGLAHIACLADLQELHLKNRIELSSDGLWWLERLPRLTFLDLSGCVSLFDDGDLAGLASLTNLQTLRLQVRPVLLAI